MISASLVAITVCFGYESRYIAIVSSTCFLMMACASAAVSLFLVRVYMTIGAFFQALPSGRKIMGTPSAARVELSIVQPPGAAKP